MFRDPAADDRMAGTPRLLAYLPQILAYPLQGFCLPVTLMIALFTWTGAQSFFGIPLLVITSIWATHYLLQVIDHTALGHATPPPMSGDVVFLDIQTVFKAILLPALGLFVAAYGPPRASGLVLGLTAFLWPAALFALAISRDWNAAANPLRWLDVIAGMGLAYLLPCALLAIGVAMLRLVPSGAGLALMTALIGYLVFATAHLLGFVGYHRRDRLGFEARVGDPAERQAKEAQQEALEHRLSRIDALMHDGNIEGAAGEILRELETPAGARAWFEDLFERLQRRRHPVLLHTAGRRLVTVLLGEKRMARALEVYEACETFHPGFEPEAPEQLVVLAQQAADQRLDRLVQKLLADLDRRYPGHPVHVPAGLVLARFWSQQGDDARALSVLEPLLDRREHPQHAQVETLARALRKLREGSRRSHA